jgi:hypothetical protein
VIVGGSKRGKIEKEGNVSSVELVVFLLEPGPRVARKAARQLAPYLFLFYSEEVRANILWRFFVERD